MTSETGTYALLLRAQEKHTIEVGALGAMRVQAGWYVYVGSAFGPGGLRARVMRHVRGDGATHWHIDHLRAATTVQAVWYTHDDIRRECDWATMLREYETARIPLAGFGASDCACRSHLTVHEDVPSWDHFRAQVREREAGHAPVRRRQAQTLRDE